MIGCACTAGLELGRDGRQRCAFCGALAAPRRQATARRGTSARDVARTERPAELGLMVTPTEIADRVKGIDRAIQALAGDVARAIAPSINAQWRGEFAAFQRRWAIERDSRTGWASRLFAWEAMPKLDAYQASYNWWARDFGKKSGHAPTIAPAQEPEGMASALVPPAVWWIAGAAALVWVLAQGAEIKALSRLTAR